MAQLIDLNSADQATLDSIEGRLREALGLT